MADALRAFAASALVDDTPLPCAALAITPEDAAARIEARLYEHGVIGTVKVDGLPDEDLAATLSADHPVSFGANILRLPVRSRDSAPMALPDWIEAQTLNITPLSAGAGEADIPADLQEITGRTGHIYGLLNQKRVPELIERAASLSLQSEALDTAQTLWLVDLPACSLRRDMLMSGPDGVWDRGPGLLVQSFLPLPFLAARLKPLSRPQPGHSNTEPVDFPFWDPALFRTLLSYLEPQDAEALLGPDIFVTLTPGRQTRVSLAQRPAPGTTAPPARFRMQQRYIDALAMAESRKFRNQLVRQVRSLKPDLTGPEAERFVDLGLDVCASVGLRTQETVSGYTMLSVLMGWDMTQRYAVAAPILDLHKPEDARKTLIHHLLGRVATRT